MLAYVVTHFDACLLAVGGVVFAVLGFLIIDSKPAEAATAKLFRHGAQILGVAMVLAAVFFLARGGRAADWQYYRTADKYCSVEFPAEPSETTSRGANGLTLKSLKLNSFGGDTAYTASVCELPDNSASDRVFEFLRGQIPQTTGPAGDPMKITREYTVTRNGTYGRAFDIASGDFLITLNYFVIRKRLYEIQAARQKDDAKEVAERFLASVKFGKP